MELRAFGPLRLEGPAGDVALGGPKQRAVLALLLADRGRLVATDRLVDEVWGDGSPAAARQSVQSYVSNLRRLLGTACTIEGAGTGYVCRPGPHALDVDRFEELVRAARAARTTDAYAAALAVTGGPPFEGFEDVPTVAVEAARIESLRLGVVEEHVEAQLASGAGPELVPELEALVARHPFRERLWAHLMVALYQGGRQTDALRCYQRARQVLVRELGLEPSPDLADLERRILDHDPGLAVAAPPSRRPAPGPAACPYKGLAPYQPEDAALFFGRHAMVDRLAAIIGSAHVVAVVGASGSGKSSLLRAGLVPALPAGWPVALLTPGADPLAQLADRLGAPADELRGDPGALHRLAGPPGGRLVVVVDQFEELFTAGADATTRLAFADALAQAVSRPDSRVSVAVAVRADFYGRCAELGALADLLSGHHVLVGPLTPSELRAAIIEPAAQAGLELEDGLVDDILADARDQAGALPLLSHALLETWIRRDGATLTRAAYRQAGGLSGAIARTAEAVLHRQLDAGERATARAVVLNLVRPGADGAPDTGRGMRLADLRAAAGDGAEPVVETLTGARLLTRDGDCVALAHDALLTSWPELQEWLADDREELVERRRLADAAAEWERLDRDPGALLRGARLAAATTLLAPSAGTASPRERAFVDAALAQERRSARRGRQVTAGLATLTIVATLAAALALGGTSQARRSRAKAQAEARVATSRRLAAQSALALGRNDRAQALLLGIEASRIAPTLEARSALGEALIRDINAAAVLLGHEGDVRSAAVTSDGTLAASAGIDGRVRVWDVAHQQERYAFGPLGGEQRDVAFNPRRPDVAGVGIDGTVRIWDAETGALRRELVPPVTPAAAPASPPAGARGTGGGGGGGGGAAPVAADTTGGGDRVPLRAVAWSPDGQSVAASAVDGRVHVWDPADGRLRFSFASGDAEIRDLAFSPDGARLAGAGRDGAIRVWTAQGETVAVLRGHSDVAFGVAWSPDGARLASVGRDRTLRLWTVATSSPNEVVVAHDAEIYGVAWSTSGTIATASADRLIRIWDGATGARRSELRGHTSDARSVAFDGQGNLVSAANDGTVRIWKESTAESVRSLAGPTDGVFELAFRPDGAALAGSGREGKVFVWKVADGTSSVLAGGDDREVFGVDFRPDGRQLASGANGGGVRLWDTAANQPTGTLTAGQDAVWDVAFSRDGSRLATAGADGRVLVWDPGQGGQPRLTLQGHQRDVFGVAVSPRAPVVASVGRDGTLRRWDLDKGGAGEIVLRAPAELRSVAFSPDGQLVTAAGADGVIRVVSTHTWKSVRDLVGHDGEVRAVSFSPDSRYLVSGGRDRNVRFWDVGTGELLASVPVAAGDVRAVAYSPDGQLVAVASNSGAVKLWPAPTDWVSRACAAAGRNLLRPEWDRLIGTEEAYRQTCQP